MKKVLLTVLLAAIPFCMLHSQTVTGKWKTVDDETGEEKSVVEIYEEDGKIYGKVVEIVNPEGQNARCEKCKGGDKDQPIMGLVVIKGLVKDGDEYNGGRILDPNNGKLYKCYLQLEEKDKLKVRGYVGFSLLGRTQYWYRVK